MNKTIVGNASLFSMVQNKTLKTDEVIATQRHYFKSNVIQFLTTLTFFNS